MSKEIETHSAELLKKRDNDYRIEQIHNYNLDFDLNQIFLFGEELALEAAEEGGTEPGVEFQMANRFIKNLNTLMRKSKEPILIHMKTCGGYWEEGMAIHNAIKACPNPTTILNYTHARSMSSLIFQAANKRVMMPDSYFMIHDGTNAFYGTQKSFNSYAEYSKTLTTRMLNIYYESMVRNGKFAGKSKEDILIYLRSRMDKKEEVYMFGKETIALGLADEIFGEHGKYNWSKLLEYTKEELSR